MQVQSKEQILETEGLDNEQKKFEISNSKRMFEILSSNIYRDKPLAVIREYGCNAYDAHIAAGREDVPFEVHLPNNFEPWFSVKDFGTGLSHQDVMKLYTTYGMSTKNNENKSIGMLGLGSKSAFAYTDQFTITSIFEGNIRIYQAFKDKEGVPTITMLSEEPTDEHPGLEIYIPARAADFSTFADRAEKIFFRFPTLPTITGNTIDLKKVNYLTEGPNYKIRGNAINYERGCWAVQGTVAYPINSSSFGTNRLTDIQERVLDRLPIDIIFPIGKLDVTASREELNYDDITQENIIAAVDEVIAHLPTQFQGVLDGCKTLWEAKLTYRKWISEQSDYNRLMLDIFQTKIVWNGLEIDGKPLEHKFIKDVERSLPDLNDPSKVRTFIEHVPTLTFAYFGEKQLDVTKRKKPEYDNSFRDYPDDTTLFIFQDVKWRSLNRSLVRLFDCGDWDCIYLISDLDPSLTQQQVIDMLGNPPENQVIMLSSLEEPAPEPRPKASPKKVVKAKLITGWGSNQYYTKDVDKDLNDGGYYLSTYKGTALFPNETGEEVRNYYVHQLLDYMDDMKLLTDRVFCFNSTYKKAAEKSPLWVSYYSEMERKLTSFYSQKGLIKAWDYFYNLENAVSDRSNGEEIRHYLDLTDKYKKKVIQPNSKFFMPLAGANIYLNIINRTMGAKFDVQSAVKFANKFFAINEIARKLFQNVPEITPTIKKGANPLDKFRTNYPCLIQMLGRLGYSGFLDKDDIVHYINLCDAAPEIANLHTGE